MYSAAYIEHLQVVLKEFDPITILIKDVLIWYFWYKLSFSIQAQLNERRTDLNMWEEVINKIIDIETKAGWQPSSNSQKINAQYSKDQGL